MALKLYLIRWPNGDTEIVSAENEMDLFSALDEVSDPYDVCWRPYRTRLWISVHVDPTTLAVCEGLPAGEASSIAGTQNREDMNEEVLKHAFPKFYAKTKRFFEADGEEEPNEAERADWMAAHADDLKTFPPHEKGWKTFDTPKMRARLAEFYRNDPGMLLLGRLR